MIITIRKLIDLHVCVGQAYAIVVVVVTLFYVDGKQPWSCRDGQLM